VGLVIVLGGWIAVAIAVTPTAHAREAESSIVSTDIPSAEDPAIAQAKMAIRKRDYQKAIRLWKEAASRGNAKAAYRLGVAYRSGVGVEKDIEQATEWFQVAADRRDPGGQFVLGTFYQNGTGVVQNRDEALRLFTLAARGGNRDAIELLSRIKGSDSVAYAAADARVTANRTDPRAALAQAIRTGDSGAAMEALARGAPINGAPGDDKHWRPLILAITKGDTRMVDLLLTHRADPNLHSRAGEPAIILAVRSGNRPLTRRLLAGHASPNALSVSGYTPLMEAARLGNDELVSDLLNAGADPKAVLEVGTSAAGVARRFGHEELARKLALRGAPLQSDSNLRERLEALSSRDAKQTSEHLTFPPVIEAARRGDTDLLAEMIAGKVDLVVKDSDGGDALTRASENGHSDAVRLLLEAGVDPNGRGKHGATAALLAMGSKEAGSESATRLLMQSGADPHVVDSTGRGMIEYAALGATSGKLQIVQEAGGSWSKAAARSALSEATEAGQLEVVEALLTVVITPEERGHAVCRATEQANLKALRILTTAGSSLEADCGAEKTPLLIAAHDGNEAFVDRLLSGGAKIDGKKDGGDTALIEAAGRGHVSVVQMLIDRGAEVNRRGKRRMTALMAAALNGQAKVAEILLGAGADRGMRSDSKHTALNFAQQSGSAETVTTIESYRPGWRKWLGSAN
jgi:uncharacterized protein